MTEFADDLIQSLTEAVAYARSDKAGARTHVLTLPDVRAVRRKLDKLQQESVIKDQRCNKAINPSS